MLEGHLKRKYIYLKKNDWKVRQYLFGKLFRQTISSWWVEKWHNFFSENHLDNQPQTGELKSETIFFGKLLRQTISNRWVDRWDNLFSENRLDKQPRTDEFQGDALL